MIATKRQSAVSTILPQIQRQDLISSDSVIENFEAEIACSDDEKSEVYQLAYQVYLSKGFVSENIDKKLIYPYDNNSDTVIFMIRNSAGKLLASATLVFNNNNLKLPCEKLFCDEIEMLTFGRKNNAEICRLVVDDSFRNQKKILISLFEAISYHVCNISEPEYLLIRVNPRHQIYYQKFFYFESFEEVKLCPMVNAPAVLMYLNISEYKKIIYKNQLTSFV